MCSYDEFTDGALIKVVLTNDVVEIYRHNSITGDHEKYAACIRELKTAIDQVNLNLSMKTKGPQPFYQDSNVVAFKRRLPNSQRKGNRS